jgi:3-oxoadipate enol-lactonase
MRVVMLVGLLSAAAALLPHASDDQPPANGYADVNGTRLYFEVVGKGPALVLVSGGGLLDRRAWDNQVGVFARRFRVIRYDIRGLGRSSRPTEEFSHSDDLDALLHFLGIKTAVLCGVSFGAAIAIDFALEHSGTVTGLVLAGPGLSSDKDTNVQGVLALSALARTQGLEPVIDTMTKTPSFLSAQNARARRRVRQIYLDNRDVFDADFPLVRFWRPTSPAASDRLAEISARTLVIVGAKDSAAIKSTADRLTSGIAGARKVIIAAAGHMVNIDAPAEFNRSVLDFLGRPAV